MIILITYLLIGVVLGAYKLYFTLNDRDYKSEKNKAERTAWLIGSIIGVLITISFWSIIVILNHIGLYYKNKNNKEA